MSQGSYTSRSRMFIFECGNENKEREKKKIMKIRMQKKNKNEK